MVSSIRSCPVRTANEVPVAGALHNGFRELINAFRHQALQRLETQTGNGMVTLCGVALKEQSDVCLSHQPLILIIPFKNSD